MRCGVRGLGQPRSAPSTTGVVKGTSGPRQVTDLFAKAGEASEVLVGRRLARGVVLAVRRRTRSSLRAESPGGDNEVSGDVRVGYPRFGPCESAAERRPEPSGPPFLRTRRPLVCPAVPVTGSSTTRALSPSVSRKSSVESGTSVVDEAIAIRRSGVGRSQVHARRLVRLQRSTGVLRPTVRLYQRPNVGVHGSALRNCRVGSTEFVPRFGFPELSGSAGRSFTSSPAVAGGFRCRGSRGRRVFDETRASSKTPGRRAPRAGRVLAAAASEKLGSVVVSLGDNPSMTIGVTGAPRKR